MFKTIAENEKNTIIFFLKDMVSIVSFQANGEARTELEVDGRVCMFTTEV